MPDLGSSALRKKTILEAYFLLHAPQFTAAPFFAPDAAGEAFFILPVARKLSDPEQLPNEIEGALAASRRSTRFTPSYERQQRRLEYYPPEAVASLRLQLKEWLLSPADVEKRPYLKLAHESVVARIPRDRESEFLDALITGFLGSNRKEFKCIVSWN